MKVESKKNLFIEMTPEQAVAINGGAYWNRGVVKGGGNGGGGNSGGGGGGNSSDSP